MKDEELKIDGTIIRFMDDSIEENEVRNLDEIIVNIINKKANDDE